MTALLSGVCGERVYGDGRAIMETMEVSMLCSGMHLQRKCCLQVSHGVPPRLAVAHRGLLIWGLVVCSSSELQFWLSCLLCVLNLNQVGSALLYLVLKLGILLAPRSNPCLGVL